VAALGLVVAAQLVPVATTEAPFTAATSTLTSFGAAQLGTPSALSCAFTGANAVSLTWTAAADGFAGGHAVQRADTSGGAYATVVTAAAPAASATDPNPAPPTSRFYTVRGTRGGWQGPASTAVTTPDCRLATASVAGTPTVWCCGANDGGPATAGRIWAPNDVAVDTAGNMYIAEKSGGRIRKVSAATGIITTIAGDGGTSACTYSGPGSGVALNNPIGLDVDPATGVVYVADTGNHCIRAISPSGTVSQVAGSQGGASPCGYTGAASTVGLNSPYDVTVRGPDLYVNDTLSNCVRKVAGATATGAVTPYVAASATAGSDQCSWSGPALQAQLSYPVTLVFDAAGNGYLSDADRDCVRRIAPDGTITRYVGIGNGQGGTAACSASGASAATVRLDNPFGLAVDAAGTLFVVDNFLHCVVKVTAGGQVSAVAFTGAAGYSGDGGWAPAATSYHPCGAALTPQGDLLVADADNHVIRRIRKP
jgi:sugar lactone lactonase YvrE